MRGVQDDLLCLICSLFPQLHISQSERRSEAGELLCLPCWLFLSPLCHYQPQSVWSWQLFCKASSLVQHGVTTPLVGAGVLVFALLSIPILLFIEPALMYVFYITHHVNVSLNASR